MENSIISFDYDGNAIHFDASNGDDIMVNLTEMAKPFGKNPHDFLRLDSTKAFIEALKSNTGFSRDSDLVRVERGAMGGTWAHRYIAVEFAGWLKIDFRVKMVMTFEEYLRTGSVGIAAPPAPAPRLQPARPKFGDPDWEAVLPDGHPCRFMNGMYYYPLNLTMRALGIIGEGESWKLGPNIKKVYHDHLQLMGSYGYWASEVALRHMIRQRQDWMRMQAARPLPPVKASGDRFTQQNLEL